MDQSKSNSGSPGQGSAVLPIPRRGFSLEFFVGLFTLVGLACAGYLSVGLGGLELVPSDRYEIIAEFDNISGLKYGASVEIAGVPVGEVTNIALKDSVAHVTLRLERRIQIREDDIASIRTKGIIGDRYVKLSRGASESFIPPGGIMKETESVVDIEDVIGKVVHSLTGEKEEEKPTATQEQK
jgi:phospholipid/cholesterol/gamma-HCH transport system substrate-binding protein